MTPETPVSADRGDAERPDGPYALVAGLYVAVLLAPALVLALSRFVDGAAGLYVGFLVAVTGVTVVAGWGVARTPGLAVRLGGHPAVWLLAVLPFGWLGAAFAAHTLELDPPTLGVVLSFFGSVAGAFLGLILVGMSHSRHADAALADVDELAVWEARWPQRWRRVGGGVAVAAFAVSTVGLLAALAFESRWGRRLYYLLFVGVVGMNVWNSRTFRATDAGLVVERPLQRRLRPWADYAGYELTDDAILIRPTDWWRPTLRCDRADVDDVDAVVSALEATLARR